MKRRYLKPESKTLFLKLGAFITAGSGNETQDVIIDPITGEPIDIPGGGSGSDPDDNPEGSRYLRRSMWEE